MMSYQDCRPLFKYHEEELIALFVETLTGTTFEMIVSPYDTIMSIKNKIQKVEGIPVGQQHLLYNLRELDDSAILMDYSITNGSTIKLVLSMRGGPISTVRRILPLDDIAWRELVEFNRDDLLEDLPPGCRMAVLVFREGDQLNMFRVLENIDGSYSPFADALNRYCKRNVLDEEEEDDFAEYAKRLKENTVTMEKMNDLKSKLEELAIQRKNRKLRPGRSEDRVDEDIDGEEEEEEDDDDDEEEEESNVVEDTSARTKKLPVNCRSRRKSFIQLPPLASEPKEVELDSEERTRKSRTTEFSRVPVLPDITPRASPPHIAILDSELEPVAVGGGSPLPRPKTSPDHLTGRQICEILSEAGRHRILRTHHYSASPVHSISRDASNSGSSFDSEWCTRRLSTGSSSKTKEKPPASTSLLTNPHRPNNTLPQGKVNRTAIISPFNIFPGRSRDSVNSLFSNSSRLGKIPASPIQTLPLRRNVPSHSSSGKPKTIVTPLQAYGRSGSSGETSAVRSKFVGIPTLNHKPVPITRTTLYTPSFVEEPGSNSSSDNNKNDNTDHHSTRNNSSIKPLHCFEKCSFNDLNLRNNNNTETAVDANSKIKHDLSYSEVPISKSSAGDTVKDSQVKKKKKEPRSRCAKCNKRLTLTNIYTCRCGNLFCSIHRYSEAHVCTYDYKGEGRKILERNNPLVTAPKLPKI